MLISLVVRWFGGEMIINPHIKVKYGVTWSMMILLILSSDHATDEKCRNVVSRPSLQTLIHKSFKTKYLSSFQPLLFSFYVQIILLIWIWNHKICFYQQEKIQYWNWQVWILTLINHFLSKPMPFWGWNRNLSIINYDTYRSNFILCPSLSAVSLSQINLLRLSK